MKNSESVWLNVKQAAAAVGVSERTLYNWMNGRRQRDGRWSRPILPFESVQDGRARRIKRDVLLRVAAKQGVVRAMEAVLN